MKYRLKKDLPYLEAGAIFEQFIKYYVAWTTTGFPYRFSEDEIKNLPEWFEPLSPQEEVEELTEDDFRINEDMFAPGDYMLKKSGRDKLIRMSKRLGKGKV